MIAPYYRNFPIAAGDVHQDGWIDVVFGTDTGIFLYANLQGKRFQQQQIDAPLQEFYVGNLALVDLNGDGWVDLFFSAYRKGAFVVYNDRGKFPAEKMERLPGPHANFANAAAFGDMDRDGDLDIVIGNWTAGPFTNIPPEDSRNLILWRENGSFRPEMMKDMPGETLSLLLSDIDMDNDLDLLIGNDFRVPDFIYTGDGHGKFSELAKDKIPHTTTTTMSIDTGDWNNDLKPELYFTQVATTRGLATKPADSGVCGEHSDATWRKRCESVMNLYIPQRMSYTGRTPKPCADIQNPTARSDCLAYYMLMHAFNKKDRSLCEAFPERWSDFAFICRESFRRKRITKDQQRALGITQIPGKNVFLVPSGSGYEDKAPSLGISSGGWSWSGRFADLDSDEWQDVYLVNGHFRGRNQESHVLFWNHHGKQFDVKTKESGLESFLPAVSYVYLDWDNDGDLDIITVPIEGPIWLYRNQSGGNNLLSVQLSDEKGNSFGIGSKIVIHYGDGAGKKQFREIKASGGFLSFDAAIAHFGLSKYNSVDSIEVFWSTGERTELTGPFPANHRYRITRQRVPN
jgi:hypothetical protein